MKWRAFSRMPQWVRLSEWLGRIRCVLSRNNNCVFAVEIGERHGVNFFSSTMDTVEVLLVEGEGGV